MGEIIARNMLSWLGIINNPILLHLVGCLYYPFIVLTSNMKTKKTVFKKRLYRHHNVADMKTEL